MGRLIHINGAPGVGKLTIARVMAARLNARVLDNHTIYNVAWALTEFRTPAFYDAVRAVRTAAYDHVLKLPDSETVILTDANFGDSDWGHESWSAVEQLAIQRRWPFFTIVLLCDVPEHRRRIMGEDRAARGKLRDASYMDKAARRHVIERDGPFSLRLDVTNRSAEDAAAILADWIERKPSVAAP
jgi:predicted kinase